MAGLRCSRSKTVWLVVPDHLPCLPQNQPWFPYG
jgi:hypothetical protein